ncbi:MAG: RluA family pseudouridine synthase [Firmicutes bacterium]|nr:RluA family pseudouridine synthase [Bacillota bacterium]
MNSLKIIYEDNHLIVSIKPAGVLSQAGEKKIPDMLTLIKSYLKDKYLKPGNVYLGLVHRLDLNVGGLMVFAKTSKSASRLSEAIRDHVFEKQYMAIVQGVIPVGQKDTLTDYLNKNEELRKSEISEESSGKKAILEYEILANSNLYGGISLAKVRLLTGRFHQIRSQFSNFGHPLLGDQKYGKKTSILSNELGLWAYYLEFLHPTSKETMTFTEYPNTNIFSMFSTIFETFKKKDCEEYK